MEQPNPTRGPVKRRTIRVSTELFDSLEHAAYIAVGALLSVAALLALLDAAAALWSGLVHWPEDQHIGTLIDRLLFVLMLAEILHTVRASMRSGGLSAEPFLIVGLIACIRRILVSTLQSAAAAQSGAPAQSGAAFMGSMVELGVLGVLVLVLVVAIYLLRRASVPPDPG
jgi:uncharacterized membrane protein (DUF373 family)